MHASGENEQTEEEEEEIVRAGSERAIGADIDPGRVCVSARVCNYAMIILPNILRGGQRFFAGFKCFRLVA